jgi:hypothetical protein
MKTEMNEGRVGVGLVGGVNGRTRVTKGSWTTTSNKHINKIIMKHNKMTSIDQLIKKKATETVSKFKNTFCCITKFFCSTEIVISLTIYMILICQNVELNTGPQNKDKYETMSIVSYNCNRLGEYKKLK